MVAHSVHSLLSLRFSHLASDMYGEGFLLVDCNGTVEQCGGGVHDCRKDVRKITGKLHKTIVVRRCTVQIAAERRNLAVAEKWQKAFSCEDRPHRAGIELRVYVGIQNTARFFRVISVNMGEQNRITLLGDLIYREGNLTVEAKKGTFKQDNVGSCNRELVKLWHGVHPGAEKHLGTEINLGHIGSQIRQQQLDGMRTATEKGIYRFVLRLEVRCGNDFRYTVLRGESELLDGIFYATGSVIG